MSAAASKLPRLHGSQRSVPIPAASRTGLLLLAVLVAPECQSPTAVPPAVVVAAPPAQPSPAKLPRADPPPEPAPRQDLVIDAVGDLMLGSTFPEGSALPPRDGAGLLAEVSPILRSADVAFGNLEGPLVDGHDPPTCTAGAIAEKRRGARGGDTSCWAFRVPARYGQHLAEAGFDVLSLANNHILDFGEAGRESTRRTLDQLGIAHSGPVGIVAHIGVRGTTIDVIAFATYDTSNDLDDLDSARALVARSAAAADVVVVSFHGGAEGLDHQHVPASLETYYGEGRGALRAFAHAMVDAGADLVLGHGPHVVRGMEIRKGRLIAYSLGSFATYGGISVAGGLGVSLILEAHLGPDGAFLGGRIHPIRQLSPGGPRRDARAEVIPTLRALSREDFGEAAVRVDDGGVLAAP